MNKQFQLTINKNIIHNPFIKEKQIPHSMSKISNDILYLKEEIKSLKKDRIKHEKEIALLKNKLKKLNFEESQKEVMLRLTKESEKENNRHRMNLMENKKNKESIKKEKEKIKKENHQRILSYKIRVRTQSFINKKKMIESQRSKSFEITFSKKQIQREIQSLKSEEYYNKRQKCLLVKTMMSESMNKKMLADIENQKRMKKKLQLEAEKVREQNNQLNKEIYHYKSEGLKLIERISTLSTTSH